MTFRLTILAGGAMLAISVQFLSTVQAQTLTPNRQSPGNTQVAPPKQPDLAGLMQQLMATFSAGKYPEAIIITKQLIAEFERMGAGDHPMQAANYASLGDLYRFTGDFSASETNHRRALAMRETAFGAVHADVASSLIGLHHLAATQGQFADAERLLARALAIRERLLAPDDPELPMTRVSVARLHALQGQHEQAEPLLRAALAAFQKTLPPEHPYIGVARINLSDALAGLGRLSEAEPLLMQALAVTEKAAGAASPLTAAALGNLAQLYQGQGRYEEAETLRRRELAITEAAGGPESLTLVPSLNNFGALLAIQRRPKEAEAILRRALAIQTRFLKPDHPDVYVTINNIADVAGQAGRRAEADALYREVIAGRESAFGPSHRSVANALDNLAVSMSEQDLFAEAEPLTRRALAIYTAALPPGHPDIARALNTLGVTLDHLGRHSEAQPLLQQALALRTTALGRAHPDVVASMLNLGSNALDRSDWRTAFDQLSAASTLWRQRQSALQAAASNRPLSADQDRMRGAFLGLAVAAERLSAQGIEVDRLTAVAFDAVQDAAGSVAANAQSRAGARAAARNPRLSAIVRERQDIAEQYAARDRQLLDAMGKVPEQRSQPQIDRLQTTLVTLAARSTTLQTTITREFPAYAALIIAQPLALTETQALLAADEAMLVLAPTRFGTLVWAVTRDAVRFVRTELTGRQATAKIAGLRCGLDATRWVGPSADTCRQYYPQPADDAPLPFDTDLAHELYRQTLGPVADLVRGRHLLIAAMDAFTTLPLHVLVTAAPAAGGTVTERMQSASWLGRTQPITTLASVASLKTQRGLARAPRAPKSYLAFANPLLLGENGDDRRAFDRQSCPPDTAQPASRVLARSRSARMSAGGGIDIETLRRGAPLPESADEVCAVARALNAPTSDVYLGARATVSAIKDLGRRNRLTDYRVLHFATHGLMVGGASAVEQALTEPAILLTPPASGAATAALADDNGLLGTSEIATLSLNADWVVLSACNTAAGSATELEPLAGLSRAFLYAGARALLVSHWEVDSIAAVKLTTRAFEEMNRNPLMPRAKALQIAMTALIASAEPHEAHPAYWAPFVVVGDGGSISPR